MHELKILEMALKNRYMGVSKADLFKALPGIKYKDLENKCEEMEREGLVKLDWFEMSDFNVIITAEGMSLLETPASSPAKEAPKPAQKFQCPLCDTIVDAEVTHCPGCGAEFV